MRWQLVVSWATALVGFALADKGAVIVDNETGFTFSEWVTEYSIGKYISFRIAIGSDAMPNSAYDAVVQIAAPNDVGWAGLAWGGNMVNNPLTVGWANGQSVVVSSQHATGARYEGPVPYTGATYQVFKTGTHTNGSHWQFTAKCSGCTAFQGASGMKYLNPAGTNTLAFASASSRPTNPSSNTSTFPVHNVHKYWSHDFSTGKNANFNELVTKNL